MRTIILTCLLTMNAHALTVGDLCRGGVEGTYAGKLGARDFNYNLVCVDEERLVMTIGDARAGVAMQYLAVSAIEGDDLIVTNFLLKNDDRKSISSKSQITYVRLNADELQHGRLRGFYRNGSLAEMPPVNARKTGTFPPMNCAAPKDSVIVKPGVFEFSVPVKGTLILDVLAGTPVATLMVDRLEGQQMMDGPTWDGTGCFTSMTSQGDGEPDARPLFILRGRYLPPDRVEFYWINYQGLHGPAVGIRRAGTRAHPQP